MYIPWWVLIIAFLSVISLAKDDSEDRIEELESRLQDLEDRLGDEGDFDDNIDPEI